MLNRERITLNPLEETLRNMPLEIGGDRFGHGIFVQSKGSSWAPPPNETPQLAQSVDTEGGQAVATTIGLRNSPVLKLIVIEPGDPAGTNYIQNPQCALTQGGYAGGGMVNLVNYSEVAGAAGSGGQAAIERVFIRDLTGFDYAACVYCPGSQSSEGIATSPVTMDTGASYMSAGVWLKGAVGGEQVTLTVKDGASGSASVNLTLTSLWQWYTVVRATTGNNVGKIQVTATSATNLTFFATGFCLVDQSAALTDYFDGTTPGCYWTGAGHTSTSVRPAPGGPRLRQIMADLEHAVTNISKNRSGTIRRTHPDAVQNTALTYDLVNAQLTWDDTSMMNAGVAQCTITFLSQPYARGPEWVETVDEFLCFNPTAYIVDAGNAANWYTSSSPNQSMNPRAGAVGVDFRLISIPGVQTPPYPFYVGEASIDFQAATTSHTWTSFKAGVVLWQSAGNYYVGYVYDNGTTSVLNIDQVTNGGAASNKATVTLGARLVAGTYYVLRFRVQLLNGNPTYILEMISGTNDPPAINSTVAGTTSYTPGSGVPVPPTQPGVYCNPGANSWFSNLRISPNMAREWTAPVCRFEIPQVPGSAYADARLIVANIATSGSPETFYSKWGMISQKLSEMDNSTNNSTDLFYEAENLVKANGASIQSVAGASGGSVVRSHALTTSYMAIVVTENVSNNSAWLHSGDYEVWIRVAPSVNSLTANISYSLQWQIAGNGMWTFQEADPIPFYPGSGFVWVSLGTVRLPHSVTQDPQGFAIGGVGSTWNSSTWVGYIGAKTDAGSPTVDLDCVMLCPITDGSGCVKGLKVKQNPTALYSADNFTLTSGTVLNAAALGVVGTTWSTSGGTTDFTEQPSTYTRCAGRGVGTDSTSAAANATLQNGRIALAGGTNAGVVQCDLQIVPGSLAGSSPYPAMGVVLTPSSFTVGLFAYILLLEGSTTTSWIGQLCLDTMTSGPTWTPLARSQQFSLVTTAAGTSSPTYSIQLQCDGYARASAFLGYSGQAPFLTLQGYAGSTFASSGFSPGIYHYCGSNNSSSPPECLYSSFWSGGAQDAAAIYSGNNWIDIRSDRAYQTLQGGTYISAVPQYVGNYPKIPNMQYDDGIARIIVQNSRNDQSLGQIDPAIDPTQVLVSITPRYPQIAAW